MKLKSFLTSLAKRKDLESIQTFIKETSLDEELSRKQLQCLWSAYCFDYKLDVDTSIYDNDLLTLWQTIEDMQTGKSLDNADWSDFDSFDLFMGEYLC